nr:MAG TPA: hypothetical protein [Bacteriophage sp.]
MIIGISYWDKAQVGRLIFMSWNGVMKWKRTEA